jgi:three-Cys-motif partner protein
VSDFFDKRSGASALKAQIVVKYLVAWGRVVAPRAEEHVVYFDPFAGRGGYKDGSKSTPLLVIEAASSVSALRDKLIIVFRDAEEAHCRDLRAGIDDLPETNVLAHRPIVVCKEVDAALAQHFEQTSLSPTFAFLDPCGYRGLTLALVSSLVKDWGCDCLIFFNYSRINAAITNTKVEGHMEALFTREGLAELRRSVSGLAPEERERMVMRAFSRIVVEQGPAKYVRWFRFLRGTGQRTSHYLVFVSKSYRGYDIMKQVMAGEGKHSAEGVPLYEFDSQESEFVQTSLFEHGALDELTADLLTHFAGDEVSVATIYERHSPGSDFVPDNYKAVLRQLEDKGIVTCQPIASERRMRNGVRTMADATVVKFPEQRG